jgi:hypothetical protein
MQAARAEFPIDFRPARLPNALVVGQVTVSVLLLICGAVVLRANIGMQTLHVGLKTRGLVEMHIKDQFRAKVTQQLAVAPIVQSVAGASKVPCNGSLPWIRVAPDASSQPDDGTVRRLHVE